MKECIFELKDVTKEFGGDFFSKKKVKAVNRVSFKMHKGEVISLIGESGSGKTTIGKMILRLLKPTRGKLLFQGRNIWEIQRNEIKKYYQAVQGIFQDPFSSFNTLFKVDRVFHMIFDTFYPNEKNRREKMEAAIGSVGMNPADVLGKYPHQLSGGQLQRLLIARALLMDVKLLVADELISMLDASTRIDILNLLREIASTRGMSVLFITHDLSLGYYISDVTLIMYRGEIVEMGDTQKVYNNPVHPYTRMLLASVPKIDELWPKDEVFLPEVIQNKVDEFYRTNTHTEEYLKEVEKDHFVVFRPKSEVKA